MRDPAEVRKLTGPERRALLALEALYVDYSHGRHAAIVVMGVERPSATELEAALTILHDAVGIYGGKIRAQDGHFVLELSMGGGCTDDGFSEEVRNRLGKALQPKLTAAGSARASVVRDNGHHKGTLVTITVTSGEVKTRSVSKISAVPGVQLAKVDKLSVLNLEIQFSLQDPGDADAVDAVTAAVAEVLGLHLTEKIYVHDSQPELALLAEFAYRPAA